MSKNVALSDEAIGILERLKRNGESYSDVVKRVAVHKPARYNWRKLFGSFKDDKEIVEIYDKQLTHKDFIASLPVLDDNQIIEYCDLIGNWYEYTKEFQKNIYFKPDKIRVRIKT